MTTIYPTIANCNYESTDCPTGQLVHQARVAEDAGLADDAAITEALDDLEETLDAEMTDDGEPCRGVVSCERIGAAEAAVAAAWTDDLRAAVERRREERYRD